ncbi:MAG TPA: 3-oxoacyl-[acyl-carrier-protein] reductase [Haloplasmataceae bacterium]
MNLEGKVAIVTGGAKGIGAAISQKLAELGATVIINYHSSSAQAEALVETIRGKGGRAKAYPCDVSDFEMAKAFVEEVIQDFGKIDILVNNAGITRDTLLLRMSEEDFDRVIDTNLKGAWNMAKHVSRYMMKARYGKIINIASVVGLIGNIGQANYVASKAGLIGLTKALAKELASRNILVNAIAPGFIQTDMTAVLSDEMKERIMQNIALGRLGSPEDVADAVCFLASDRANYITGQVLNVCGGLVM